MWRTAWRPAGSSRCSTLGSTITAALPYSLKAPLPPPRSVRMLGLAFLFMAGLGAMVEERGLSSRSILNNPDLRPQTETATKFADVKGVDEAKVG